MDPPLSRALHAFFRDPETDTYWSWGGLEGFAPTARLLRMTLVDGVARWTVAETAEAPSPRYGFFYAFDPERGHLTVFGGAQATAMAFDPAQDVWRLDLRSDPPTWTRLVEDTAAPGRRNGVFAFDPTGPRMWVFGGTADARTTEPGLWAIDTITGEAEEVARDGEPPLRSSDAGLFDPGGPAGPARLRELELGRLRRSERHRALRPPSSRGILALASLVAYAVGREIEAP